MNYQDFSEEDYHPLVDKKYGLKYFEVPKEIKIRREEEFRRQNWKNEN